MSIARQIFLSLLLIAIVAGGWVLVQRPAFIFGTPEETAEATRPAGPGTSGGGGPGGAAGARPGGFGQALVVTAPVGTDDSATEVRAIGSATAARAVTLYAQVSGIVTALSFTPGSEVRSGEVLVELDDGDQQVALDRANIALESARETLDRSERLERTGNVTAAVLSDARKAVQQAEIDVRMAELDLAKRSIRAPFDGVIGLTDVTVGDLVTSQTAIATVADMSSVIIAFDVPERVVGSIRPGDEVSATAASIPGVTFTGTISAIDNRIDTATRMMRVEATLPNQAADIKPGMTVTTDLAVSGDSRPTVPSLAIQWDREGSFVWKLDGDAVARTGVQIVARRSGTVTIAGALAPGDEVVVEGVLRLREGMAVTRAAGSVEPAATPDADAPDGEPPEAVSGSDAAPVVVPRAAARSREAG
jgi:RND family efflux transporter MFP subunit